MAKPPERPSTPDVTVLLKAWSAGDSAALDQLAPIVYSELRRLARSHLSRERTSATLETGVVLNEAFIRLVRWKEARWENRAHFYGLASQMMRRVLVDHARSHAYQKRGGDRKAVSLDDAVVASPQPAPDLIELDEALSRLCKIDERKSKVVELRFFGGLSVEETAKVLQVSPFTVIRDWNMAKAWLHRELRGNPAGEVEADD